MFYILVQYVHCCIEPIMMSEGSGGKKRKDFQTYLAPVSVKLIINLLEHHFFPPSATKGLC